MARYFHLLVHEMGRGSVKPFRSSVRPAATLDLFGIGTYTGPSGWEAAQADWLEPLSGLTIAMTEYLDPPGTNRVALIGTMFGRGGQSGIDFVADQWGLVLEIESGMTVWGRHYTSKAEALEAVGLAEDEQ